MSLTPVGIVGFSGYSGAELVSLLAKHPHVEPVLLEHRDGGDRARPLGHDGPRRLPCSADSVRSAGLAAVFFATPPEVSMELAGPMLDAGAKVIDLSGAFRLGTAENYQRWYKEPHTQPELLKEAVYGLPEFCRGRVATGATHLEPRLLSDRRQSCDQTADRGGRDRSRTRNRLRRQERRQRRRAQSFAQNQLLRSHRKFLRLFDSRPSSRTRSTAHLRPRGSRVQLHRAIDPDSPGHS